MTWTSLAKRSLRDPAGSLYEMDGRFIRFVRPEGVSNALTALRSKVCQTYFSNRSLAGTQVLTNPELLRELATQDSLNSTSENSESGMLLEHERISFPSYPQEWCPEMLWEAGRLTLDLAIKVSDEGLKLKDATPYNVLFRGPDAVFVDLLSIEKNTSAQPVWMPFGQFMRTFLSPLLANRYFRLPIGMIFLNRREGLEPEQLFPLTRWWQRFTQPFFSVVTMPYWLSRFQLTTRAVSFSTKSENTNLQLEKNAFVLKTLLKYLRGLLVKLEPRRDRESTWVNYTQGDAPYTDDQQQAKKDFVSEVLRELKPARVLDVGCNTGVFSEMAAESGAEVVAIDRDEACIGKVWRKAREKQRNILPLVVDIVRPTPALGWNNEETSGFIDRGRGQFDVTMWLAVIHHMVYGDGIPLTRVLDLVADLTKGYAVVEFMEPDDTSVKSITAHRASVSLSSQEQFEHALAVKFVIMKSFPLSGGTRRLYLLAKRA